MSCTYTDNQIVDQWLECQPSPLTRSCYAREAGLGVDRAEVILGYCTHQMLLAGAAKVTQLPPELG
jgi:hypothetical protein